MTISDRDVRTMLRVIDSPDDAAGPDAPLPLSVLHGLKDLIRCDTISFFQLDSAGQTMPMGQELPDDYYSPQHLVELERAALGRTSATATGRC